MFSLIKHGKAAAAEIEKPIDGGVQAVDDQPIVPAMYLTYNADGVSEIRYRWQASADGRSWTSLPHPNARLLSKDTEYSLSLTLALTYIFIDSAYSSLPAYADQTADADASGSHPSQDTGDTSADVPVGDDQPATASGDHGTDTKADAASTAAPAGNSGFDHGGQLIDLLTDVHVTHGSSGQLTLVVGGDAPMGHSGIHFSYTGLGETVIHGTEGNDTLFGTRGNDTIYGEGGNDNIFGREGDDVIYGGAGDDKVSGGEGNDTISGGTGNDVLAGNSGNDVLDAGEGADKAYGGTGNDVVHGGAGNDIVSGGTGNDVVYGDAGDDVVMGGDGDDIVSGGIGDDILFGGAGHDLFIYREGDGNDAIMDFDDDYDQLQFGGDDVTYVINTVDYGIDYTFKDGGVLAVHGQHGKGSGVGSLADSSESDHGGSGSSGPDSLDSSAGNSGSGSIDDVLGDEFDYSGFVAQSIYDSVPGADADDVWSDLVATGVIEPPSIDPVQDYAPPLSDMIDDHGLHSLLGVSTIPVTYDEHNLFG